MDPTKVRTLFLLLLIVSIGLHGCWMGSSSSGAIEVKLGQQTFAIPEAYRLEDSVPDWLHWLPGLDEGSRDFLLKFRAAEVAQHVPGYRAVDGTYQEDIVAVLAVLTSGEVKRYEGGERISDLWYGAGSYRDAIVEPLGATGWLKVFRKVEYPHSWAVVRHAPNAERPMPDPSEFWIAQCLSGDSPLTPSGKRVACKSYVLFDDLVVDFEVSEQNLRIIDSVGNYLKAKVIEWRQQ